MARDFSGAGEAVDLGARDREDPGGFIGGEEGVWLGVVHGFLTQRRPPSADAYGAELWPS